MGAAAQPAGTARGVTHAASNRPKDSRAPDDRGRALPVAVGS